MRKVLVTTFSIIYMVLGLLSFASALFPYSSNFIFIKWGFITINIFSLVGGALAFYAGMTMLKLNDFGRKLVVILLSIRAGIDSFMLVWFFLYLKGAAGLGIYYLGKQIYWVENRYAYPGILLVEIAIILLGAAFLSQAETRRIFISETMDGLDLSNETSDNINSDILI